MRRALALLSVLIGCLAGFAAAEEPLVTRMPEVKGLVLDGRDDEAAWKDALVLEGPVLQSTTFEGAIAFTPTRVRVATSDGYLWLQVGLQEAYGPGIGFSAMVAPDGTATADDATWLAYAPQSIRSPRYVARSPRGIGRGIHRLEGRWAKPTPTAWSVEARVSLRDLGITDAQAPIRLAVVVRSRNASIVGWVPEKAAFQAPSAWLKLQPPSGGWALTSESVFDAARVEKEDEADLARMDAWRRYLVATQLRPEEMLKASERIEALTGEGDPKVVREAVHKTLLAPLDDVVALRPDLGIAQVFRAEVLAGLGETDAARKALRAAQDLVEGRFALAFRVEAPALVGGVVGEASDWKAAFERVDTARAATKEPIGRDGIDFAEALLRLAHGEATRAKELLEPLAARYPFQAAVVFAAERAAKAEDFEARERQYQAREDDLPRLRIETSEGEIEVVLFEDDAPNTVRNIVWLAEHGWYDGRKVTRSIPFLGAQAGGDTGTTADAGPGYAIPSEAPQGPMKRRRMPLRGTLVMLAEAPDQEGARLFLLAGTHLGLVDRFTVFGRVAKGLEVLDRLRQGTEIRKVTVSNKRPGRIYRPETMSGEPAAEPTQPK